MKQKQKNKELKEIINTINVIDGLTSTYNNALIESKHKTIIQDKIKNLIENL